MSYLQTTCSNVTDLMNKIANFSAQFGWSVARDSTFDYESGNPGSRKDKIVVLSKVGEDNVIMSGVYFNPDPNTIGGLYLARSFGAITTGNMDNFPSRSGYALANFLSGGPYVNLYLFGENDYIHCVMEHAAGRFRHFGFGKLIKKGTWNGGAYVYGHYWEQASYAWGSIWDNHTRPFGQSRNNFDVVNSVRCSNSSLFVNGSYYSSNMSSEYLFNISPNFDQLGTAFVTGDALPQNGQTSPSWPVLQEMVPYTYSAYNQRVSLTRIPLFCSDSGHTLRYIGEYPAVRSLMINAFVPGEEFTIGSDVWKIFPIVSKTFGTPDIERTGNYGLAYRKVT